MGRAHRNEEDALGDQLLVHWAMGLQGTHKDAPNMGVRDTY